jgi:hypothetical protein
MSPGPLGHLCQCDIFPPMGVVVPQSLLGKESDCGGTDTRSLQYSRLREELTMEGEQLLSDLSYMQHLYQGSEWQDDAAETGESVPDWRPEEEETDGDQKLRYLSPAEDSTQEMMMYAEDAECNYIVPACQSLVKQRKVWLRRGMLWGIVVPQYHAACLVSIASTVIFKVDVPLCSCL